VCRGILKPILTAAAVATAAAAVATAAAAVANKVANKELDRKSVV